MGKNIKWTYELVKEYVESLGYELISDKYINNKTKLLFKDKEGYYYYNCIDQIRKSKPSKFHKSNPYTIQNIILWCKLNNKPFELLDNQEYKGNGKKLKWQCLKKDCKEIFQSSWSDIQSGCGCGFCHGLQVGLSNCLATKNPNLVKEWHPMLNGNLTPYDVTCGCIESIWWICNKGHEWKSTINNRVSKKTICPYCAGSLPTEENNLLINNPELCKEWDYKKNNKLPEDYLPNSNQKVWWVCKECDWEWFATIDKRNNGRGCPKCAESKGEKQLDLILTKYNIPHDSQYTFDNLLGVGGGLLKFDASVFWDKNKIQLRMLIEYDGIFHYEKQYDDDGFETLQIHDELKNQYCKNNNIKLLRIPYWEFNNIEEILIRELNLNDIKLAI